MRFAGAVAKQLDGLRAELGSKIQAMDLDKNILENALASKLQEILRQREELEKKEAALIQAMLRDDMDNKALIGQLLEESVYRIFYKQGGDDYQGDEDEEREDSETGKWPEEGKMEGAEADENADIGAGREDGEQTD